MALGGGTGATIGGTGFLYLDKDLARRMRLQDEAVLMLLLVVYFLTLFFSGSLAYRQAKNRSPITFYADPRYHTASMESFNLTDFLEAFNQSPKGTYLRVTGFTPTYADAPGSVSWRGGSYTVDFTFALDLSPWVIPDSAADRTPPNGLARLGEGLSARVEPGGGRTPQQEGTSYALREDGVSVADAAELRRFLAAGPRGNDLAIVDMQKEIVWSNWEELATNIKLQIRQRGFEGVIGIDRTEDEIMSIYKNTQWANFMHSKSLKVILALSVIGWAVYAPYMWFRCTRSRVRCRHRVNIQIGEYWRLIADNLSSHGFDIVDWDSDSFWPVEEFSTSAASNVGDPDMAEPIEASSPVPSHRQNPAPIAPPQAIAAAAAAQQAAAASPAGPTRPAAAAQQLEPSLQASMRRSSLPPSMRDDEAPHFPFPRRNTVFHF